MKKLFIKVILILLAVGFQSLIFGQTPEQDRIDHERNKQKAAQGAYDSISKPVSPTARADVPPIPSPKLPNTKSAELKKIRREEQAKLKQLRTPNPEDLTKYQGFLKKKNTGLFKLFPDLGCSSQYIVKVDKGCENAVQDSWAYSFLYRDYGDSSLYDLRLKDEKLIADAFLSQSILVALGDIDLETISLATSGMKFLTEFQPQSNHREAKEQFAQIAQKVISDGFTYGKVVNLNENLTYALRIAAYQIADKSRLDIKKVKKPVSESDARFFLLKYEKRRDKIIAFRIIRKDLDGSITILWKELSDRNPPILIFEKDEKLTDLKTN